MESDRIVSRDYLGSLGRVRKTVVEGRVGGEVTLPVALRRADASCPSQPRRASAFPRGSRLLYEWRWTTSGQTDRLVCRSGHPRTYHPPESRLSPLHSSRG